MKSLALWIIKKYLTPEMIAKLLTQVIAHLLRKASKTKNWDLFKSVVKRVEQACHLFNEAYDDDDMDEQDEERIADAIEELTDKVDATVIIDKIKK